MRRKVHITAQSLRWIIEIDRHVREYGISGSPADFRDVAADVLDGWALRSELADLTRRRLLTIVEQGFDDSMGRDPLRRMDPDLCGTGWSVNPTERLIYTLWPDRIQGHAAWLCRSDVIASAHCDDSGRWADDGGPTL